MRTLLAVGTSVTAATDIGAQYSYANLLAYQASYDHFYNRGLSGDYCSQLKGRLQSCLNEASPTHTIIEIGINDVDRNTISTFQSDLSDCIDMVRNAGSTVTLAQFNVVRQTQHGIDSPPYLQAIENLAASKSCPIIRWYQMFALFFFSSSDTLWNSAYYDSRHPSASGHVLMKDEWNKPQNAAALTLLNG